LNNHNSKYALAAIYKQFGANVLLGKLNSYFSDFIPSVSLEKRNNTFYAERANKSENPVETILHSA